MNAFQKSRQRMLNAARDYAAFDKSDPFAFARAKTHIDNGVATISERDGKPAYYEAEPYTETRRLPAGQEFSNGETEFKVIVHKNMARP